MRDTPPYESEKQKEIKYFLDFTPLSHRIDNQNCYNIEITLGGVKGKRVITESEVKELEDTADDTPKRLELLKRFWADSPKIYT